MKKESKTKFAAHKEQLLNSIFLRHSKRFFADLKIIISDKERMLAIYSDFLDMLLNAQRNEKVFEEIIPDYNSFLASCVENEKQNNIIVKSAVKFKKPLITAFSVLTAITLIFIFLYSSGYMNFWQNGFSYLANSEDYTHTGYRLDKTLDFEVNLKKDNENLVIYNDGTNKIEVNRVNFGYTRAMDIDGNQGEIISYYYCVVLKCTGIITKKFAQIIRSSVYGEHENSIRLSYVADGIAYIGTMNEYFFFEYNDYTEISLIVGCANSIIIVPTPPDPWYSAAALPPTVEDFEIPPHTANEFIEILSNLESVSISLSGLVINQWIKK